jgi:hypothetical protein
MLVFVEWRIYRRRAVSKLANSFGFDALKQLRKDVTIKDAEFAGELGNLWQVQ